ncbi:fluoride efflux transporter CrcB [soil metagenome]
MDIVWISIGGVAGVNCRYFVFKWAVDRFGPGFPYGTLLVNLSGALLIGILATALTEWLIVDPRLRLFVVIGFLGSYTTFSTFSYDAFILADRGDWARTAAYVLGTNFLCLAACLMGVIAVRALFVR